MINPGFSTHNVQMSQRYVVLSSTCPTPTARAGAPLCICEDTLMLCRLLHMLSNCFDRKSTDK